LETLEGTVTLPRLPTKDIALGGEAAGLAILLLRSGVLDPGVNGYWLTFSANNGQEWTPPLYTGLVEGEPYDVLPYVHFPLIEMGNIRLESLLKGSPANDTADKIVIFLNIPLDALRRDSDSDRLTDIMEERLLTDPNNPDTDGDTLPDFIDPAPLTAKQPSTDADFVRVAALKRLIEKSKSDWAAEALRGGLIIIGIKTPDEIHDFPGLPAKVIHLDAANRNRYKNKFGARAVFSFDNIKLQGNRASVQWSREKEKGSIFLQKRAGKWDSVP